MRSLPLAAVPAVVGLLVGLTAASGCTPRAGHVRPQHALLRGELGTGPLSPGSLGAVLGVTREPADTPEARRARDRIALAARGVIGDRNVVVNGERFRFDWELPRTEEASQRTLCIPMHHSLSESDVAQVIECIHDFGKTV